MFWPFYSVWYFGGPFVSLASLCFVSFPSCWRLASVTPIPKDTPSSSVANCRPISITPVLSKVFERQIRLGLCGLCNANAFIQPHSSSIYRKVLDTRDTFCVSHTLQRALERRQEAGLFRLTSVQLFTRSINDQGISSSSVLWALDVLCCLFFQFLSNRSQALHCLWWRVVGANWLLWCQECLRALFYFGPAVVPPIHREVFYVMENKLYGYADD